MPYYNIWQQFSFALPQAKEKIQHQLNCALKQIVLSPLVKIEWNKYDEAKKLMRKKLFEEP